MSIRNEGLVADSGVSSGSVGLSERLKAIQEASSSLNASPSLVADTQRRRGPGGTTTVECHHTQDGNTEVNTTLESNRWNPLSRMRGGYIIRTEGTNGAVDNAGGINLNPLGTSTIRSRAVIPGRADAVSVTGGSGNVGGGINVIRATAADCSPQR
jgi:hypothetical protein